VRSDRRRGGYLAARRTRAAARTHAAHWRAGDQTNTKYSQVQHVSAFRHPIPIRKYRTRHGSLATLQMDRPLWSVHESRVGLTILRPIGLAAFAYVPILNTPPLPHRPRSAI
jgi:hypothetical protein